jgi:hypothetical protein
MDWKWLYLHEYNAEGKHTGQEGWCTADSLSKNRMPA